MTRFAKAAVAARACSDGRDAGNLEFNDLRRRATRRSQRIGRIQRVEPFPPVQYIVFGKWILAMMMSGSARSARISRCRAGRGPFSRQSSLCRRRPTVECRQRRRRRAWRNRGRPWWVCPSASKAIVFGWAAERRLDAIGLALGKAGGDEDVRRRGRGLKACFDNPPRSSVAALLGRRESAS